MKPKIIGIIVVATLAISLIFTTVGAVQQAIQAEDSRELRRDLFVNSVEASDREGADSAAYGAFTFICPFH